MRVAAAQMALRIYSDEQDFAETVDDWARRATDAGADLLVFPEDLGLPLAFADCAAAARRRKSPAALAAYMIWRRRRAVLGALFTPGVSAKAALFLDQADRTRSAYDSACSQAAKRHDLTIIGGSIPLPGEGPLASKLLNRCGVFGPDGSMLGMIPKVNLVDMERKLLGMTAGNLDDLRVFEAGGVTFAPTICFDAWHAPVLQRLTDLGAELIASPQANPLPWTEREKAANREGLIAWCAGGSQWGVQSMAVGRIAGLRFEGQSAIIGPGETGIVAEAPDHLQEALVVADVVA